MSVANKRRSMNNISLTDKEKNLLRELKRELLGLAGDSLEGLFLYGSKAKGDFDAQSDIDVIIIVRGLSRELKDNILKARRIPI